MSVDFSTLSPKQTLKNLDSALGGLSHNEATRRFKRYGANQLSLPNRWGWLKKLLEPFKSAFIMVLLLSAGFSWAIGHTSDSLIIIVIIGLSAIIDWAQQISASRILNSLKRFNTHQVAVRRNGRVIKLNSTQLVIGDIILIQEGDKIAADGRVLHASDLSIDEAVLTGESQPVNKNSATRKSQRPIYKQSNMVFSGTLCVGGRGIYVVTATANQTAFGKIAALAHRPSPQPPIYRKIRRLTFYLVIAALVICAAVVGLELAHGNPLDETLRFATALLVSVIPEGLPVSLTVIFLVGVRQMARRHALVRNLTAVETLGMVTAIATDKTGTLTHSHLELAEFWSPDGQLEADDHTQLWLSVSHRHPDLHHPIERLITEYTATRKAPHQWQEVDDLPFNTGRRATWVLWRKQKTYRLYLKGAPEVLLNQLKLTPAKSRQIKLKLNRLTAQGMRVVAIAYQPLNKRPANLGKFKPTKLRFIGLVGFREQLRADAAEAIAATKAAGISVYMLTGDHLQTAQALGNKLGVGSARTQALAGTAVLNTPLKKLATLMGRVRVFGRVLPEHKYKLLRALQLKHITAMTGDGVNDVPALTRAEVGIAMGSGTDAAKEAADIVLLDDDYSTIVRAITAGRTIYANIRKIIYFQLATNLGEALTVVGGLVLGMPLPLTAAQILWINLVTDTTMIIPLGLERGERRQMLEPPRPPQESLLSRHLGSRLVLNAIIMAAAALVNFAWFRDSNLAMGQTMAFLTLCTVQWVAALNARSETAYSWQLIRRANPYLWGGIILSILLVIAAIEGPLSRYVGTTSIEMRHLWALLPVIVLSTLMTDLHKWYSQKRLAK